MQLLQCFGVFPGRCYAVARVLQEDFHDNSMHLLGCSGKTTQKTTTQLHINALETTYNTVATIINTQVLHRPATFSYILRILLNWKWIKKKNANSAADKKEDHFRQRELVCFRRLKLGNFCLQRSLSSHVLLFHVITRVFRAL